MDTNFSVVGLAGDFHGDLGWTRLALKNFQLAGITHVLQLGDFGVWGDSRGKKFRYRVSKFLKQYGNMMLYVTLGNHEDYSLVETFISHPEMVGFVYEPDYPNILYATRGARWVWEGVSFVSLGGANSIDYAGRIEGYTWWKGEQISVKDVYAATAGGFADVMLTHDCPIGVDIFGSHRSADHGWLPTEIDYAEKSRIKVRQAVDEIKPGILFHGHYHMKLDFETVLNDGKEDYVLHSVGLDMNTSRDNMGFLILPEKQFEWLPLTWDARKEVMSGN